MIYSEIEGHPNRRIAFITVNEVGAILSSTVSKGAVLTDRTGHTLIVDDYVADQITKFIFIDGELVLQENEELNVPVKTEKERMMEELQRRMAELQAMPDEPADIEENTDVPLLDYTDEPTE